MMLKGDSLELDKGAAAPWCTSRATLDQPWSPYPAQRLPAVPRSHWNAAPLVPAKSKQEPGWWALGVQRLSRRQGR